MPPADDQQNVNPSVPPQGDAPQGMSPAPEGGPQPMQPQVFSPTVGQTDDAVDASTAAPGFSSLPDAPAAPADVPPAAPAAEVPPAPVPDAGAPAPANDPTQPPAGYQDPGDVPVFPPTDDDLPGDGANQNPPAAV